jgi:hypothetical protein
VYCLTAMNRHNLIRRIMTLLFLITPMTSFSQVVKQVKNTKILIEFSGATTANKDDEFFVMNENNKRSALVKITQVKGTKALGIIVKGTAAPGNKVIPRKATATAGLKASESSAPAESPSFIRFDKMKLGINLKMMMNAISAKQIDALSNQETVAMKGSNMGLSLNMDMPLAGRLVARGEAGVEMLDVKGTGTFTSCDGKTSTNCNAQITYLTLGAAGRYDLIQSKFNLWVGGGGLIKIPLSKKSTSLDESKIEMANSIYVATGFDYMINNKSFIPLGFEYHLSLNKSDTVPVIDQMNFTIGYGFIF